MAGIYSDCSTREIIIITINPAVGCHYYNTTSRGLLPVSLLGEQRHDGCEQFA